MASINLIEASMAHLYYYGNSDYTRWAIRIENASNLHSDNPNDYIILSQVSIPMAFRIVDFGGGVVPFTNTTTFTSKNYYQYLFAYSAYKSKFPVIMGTTIDYANLDNEHIYYDGDNNGNGTIVFSASLLPTSDEDAFIIMYEDYDD